MPAAPYRAKYRKPPAASQGQAKLRRCLGGCGEFFPSNWAGERVCKKCRGLRSRSAAMAAPASSGGRVRPRGHGID